MPVEVSLSSIHNIQMQSSPIKFAKVYQLTVKLFKKFEHEIKRSYND